MAVEDNFKPAFASALDEHIQNLQPGLTREIGIDIVVDALRHPPRDERIIAKRHADRIEAKRSDLIEHGLPVAGP